MSFILVDEGCPQTRIELIGNYFSVVYGCKQPSTPIALCVHTEYMGLCAFYHVPYEAHGIVDDIITRLTRRRLVAKHGCLRATRVGAQLRCYGVGIVTDALSFIKYAISIAKNAVEKTCTIGINTQCVYIIISFNGIINTETHLYRNRIVLILTKSKIFGCSCSKNV